MAEWIMKEETDMDGVGCYIRKGELIRCKDCKHWNANNDTHRCFVWCVYTCGDGYCHRAERKEE